MFDHVVAGQVSRGATVYYFDLFYNLTLDCLTGIQEASKRGGIDYDVKKLTNERPVYTVIDQW